MTGMANFFYKEPDNKHFFFFIWMNLLNWAECVKKFITIWAEQDYIQLKMKQILRWALLTM